MSFSLFCSRSRSICGSRPVMCKSRIHELPMSNPSNSSARAISMGVYLIYFVGCFTGLFWLIGLFVAFVFRDNAKDDPLISKHMAHQIRMGIRLLIWGIVASVVAFLLTVTVVGVIISWIPVLIWWLCALVASLKGLLALVGERAPS